MRTKITASRITSLFKLMVLAILTAFTCDVYAEYYVVYSEQVIGGCPPSGCYTAPSCGTCNAYPSCYASKCKKYKTVAVRKRHRSNYNISTYYVWPMYAGTLWVPRCGGDCTTWVPGYCQAPDCQDFYVPPQYIIHDSDPPDFDMRTSDDF